ncbi:hybrid sensor histidine kinase/response regulator [Methanoplanus endosymbiosus]|uniref:histidine kinase n=1 Tax=Methanoplanus endosymbiosus TaxID=33865 RepID=A0A9E7TLL9_9EURY|nr:PAS domain S-box protein [Methanoplanus endosymbiosus]UUX92506.1 PAS domain S-box protein [Methanoplanus endosymbiosus]
MNGSESSKQTLSILYVDDEPVLLEAGKLYLEHIGDFNVTTCESASDALELLSASRYDTIISDYQMPECDGILFLNSLRGRGDNTPFIIFTGKGREEVVIEALNSGADFYIQKGGEPKSQFAELTNKIRYAVAQRKGEEALHKSEERYRQLFENMTKGFALHEIITNGNKEPADYRFLAVNPAFEKLTGLKAEEIIGRRVLEVLPGTEDYWIETYGDVALTGKTAEFENYSRELDQWYDVFAYSPKTGQFAVTFTDRTARKEAEEEIKRKNKELADAEEELHQQLDELVRTGDKLNEVNEHLNRLITYANGPIIVWNPELTITRFNHAFEDLTGIPAVEAVGKNLRILFPEEKRETAIENIRAAMAGSRMKTMEMPLLHRSGDMRTVIWNLANIMSHDGSKLVSVIAQGQDITEQIKAEKVIPESEERFRGLFDTITSGVAIYQVQGDGKSGKDYIIRDFNRMALEIEGRTKSEVVGKSLFDLRPNIDEYGLIPIFQRVWETGIPEYYPQKIYTDEKYANWYDNRVFRLRSGEIVSVYNDITEQKRAETALKENEEYLNTVLHTARDGFVVIDSGGRIKDANEAYSLMSGYLREELVGMKISDLDATELPEQTLKKIDQIRNSSELFEVTNRKKDGSLFEIEVSAIWLDMHGGEIICFCRDITKRRRAERALSESEAHFRDLFRNHAAVKFIIDPENGRIIDANPAAAKFYGWSEEELRQMKIYEINTLSPEEINKELKRATEEGRVHFEFRHRRADGSIRDVDVYSSKIKINDKYLLYSIVHDISERKQAEYALIKTNRQLNLLSGITRHDILNKIMVLQGFLEFAEEDCTDQVQSGYLKKVHDAASAIQRQIEFTREYEQLGVHEPVWLSITALTEKRYDNKYPIICNCSGLFIYADPMTEKVFSNLYDNTIRHAKGATGISISCSPEDSGYIIIWEDDGCGVPDDMKKKIFNRGVGANTGLGLFLIREILAITGITIRETGVYGKGARFEMTIPAGAWKTD